MTTRQVIDCDRCGKPNIVEPISIFLCTDRITSAAGCGREDVGEDRDLCPKCAGELLKYLLKDLTHKQAQDLVPLVSKR